MTNRITRKYASYIFNSVLLLLFNTQILVKIFSSTYLTWMMISSVHSVEALSGKAVTYLFGIVFVFIFSLLPVEIINFGCQKSLLSIFLGLELCFTLAVGNSYSPIYGLVQVMHKMIKVSEQSNMVEQMGEDSKELYYKSEIADYYTKPSGLTDRPNIILIFTEGLSQNIIEDKRNIMPNAALYQKRSLNFINYFNHTYATYRGIVGQLYSGYVLHDSDTIPFASLQSILHDNGYFTAFINTEPNNYAFTKYLETFDFDLLVSDAGDKYQGAANSLSDKEAYSKLWEVLNCNEKGNAPIFECIYTFGTHHTFDSTDKIYGDGSDPMLNKFYNADYWFGEFMNQFENSGFSDNTIVVFTSDYATYRSQEFMDTFSEYQRDYLDCDRIPFFIYYSGINAEELDVGGMTSIGLAPTILDYLDISGENYFLRNSIFGSGVWQKSDYANIFCTPEVIYNTDGGMINPLSDIENNIIEQGINKYYSLCSER